MASKYHNVRTTCDGLVFDSAKEARRYGELKMLARAHHNAKMTNLLVLEIRRRLRDGMTQRKTGRQLGIPHYWVNDISRGRLWRHVVLVDA